MVLIQTCLLQSTQSTHWLAITCRVYENRHQGLHHRNVEWKGVLISVVSCVYRVNGYRRWTSVCAYMCVLLWTSCSYNDFMYSSSWTLVYVHACTCTACIHECTRSGTNPTHTYRPTTACTIYIHIQWTLYSLRHDQIPILVFLRRYIKSPVFLNIRTLIRSCDEYKFVFPPPPPQSLYAGVVSLFEETELTITFHTHQTSHGSNGRYSMIIMLENRKIG